MSGTDEDSVMPKIGSKLYNKLNIIIEGTTIGLSVQDILMRLEEGGHNVSERSYYRLLDKINAINSVRLKNMPEEFKAEYLKRIDTLNKIQQELWKIVNNDEIEAGEKIRALQQLKDIQTNIQMFYNAGPIVYGMMKAVESKRNTPPILEHTATSSIRKD